MSMDRRSDKPQSRTLHAGQSVTLHGVRIDCVRIEGETCRIRVWREVEIQTEGESSDVKRTEDSFSAT